MSLDSAKYDVFFSHSHEDVNEVEFLAKKIEDRSNHKVWLDRWVLVPGKKWQQELARGLGTVKCCAVFIGKNTPSGWFEIEIERAIDRQANDPEFRVMAVLLPGADMKIMDSFLSLRTWVDLRKGIDDEKEFHTLICGINGTPRGRGPELSKEKVSETVAKIKSQLKHIKDLLCEGLIDDEMAKEYRRKLIDNLIMEI